ncbi:MAG: hypothetical protein ACTH54_02825 [Vagococcus salmoninarum]|uniref:hypothetical protein n=1 Tax=Vagococcus salmoninarum TaxID=2739 RepID=UPI003F9A69C6
MEILDVESYEYGVRLLEQLLDGLPEDLSRKEAIDKLELALDFLKASIEDEA